MRSMRQILESKHLDTFGMIHSLAEARSKNLGNGKFEYEGHKGVWRTAGNGDHIFWPDDKKVNAGKPLAAARTLKYSSGAKEADDQEDAVYRSVDRMTRRADYNSRPKNRFGEGGGGGTYADELEDLAKDYAPENRAVDKKYGGPTKGRPDAESDAIYKQVNKVWHKAKKEELSAAAGDADVASAKAGRNYEDLKKNKASKKDTDEALALHKAAQEHQAATRASFDHHMAGKP